MELVKPCRKCGATERHKSGQCAPCNRAWQRASYAKNKERDRAVAKAWHEKNADKENLRTRTWREKNPEKHRAAAAAWRKRNPEKVKGYHRTRYRRRQEARMALVAGDQNYTAVEAIFIAAKWLRSRGVDVHVDHIVPLVAGGVEEVSNLAIVPASYNLHKQATQP